MLNLRVTVVQRQSIDRSEPVTRLANHVRHRSVDGTWPEVDVLDHGLSASYAYLRHLDIQPSPDSL